MLPVSSVSRGEPEERPLGSDEINPARLGRQGRMELVAQPAEGSLFQPLLACSPSHTERSCLTFLAAESRSPRNDKENSPRLSPGPWPARNSAVAGLTGN